MVKYACFLAKLFTIKCRILLNEAIRQNEVDYKIHKSDLFAFINTINWLARKYSYNNFTIECAIRTSIHVEISTIPFMLLFQTYFDIIKAEQCFSVYPYCQYINQNIQNWQNGTCFITIRILSWKWYLAFFQNRR